MWYSLVTLIFISLASFPFAIGYPDLGMITALGRQYMTLNMLALPFMSGFVSRRFEENPQIRNHPVMIGIKHTMVTYLGLWLYQKTFNAAVSDYFTWINAFCFLFFNLLQYALAERFKSGEETLLAYFWGYLLANIALCAQSGNFVLMIITSVIWGILLLIGLCHEYANDEQSYMQP